MTSQLFDLLQATIQPDQNARTHAEQILKSIEMQNGFLSGLLQLATTSNSSVSQAAAIYFKNRVRAWDTLPAEDKEFTKKNIFEAINHSTSTRPILLTSIGIVITYETRETDNWPELIPMITHLLSSHDSNVLYTGLTVLLEIIKCWQWYSSEKRIPLNKIISTLFPAILSIAVRIEKCPESIEALFLLKCIVKIFSYATRMDLAKDIMEPKNLVVWSNLFICIVEWKWIDSSSIPISLDADDREKHIYWKCKKWSYRNLNCLMGRYAIARKKDKKYSAFSKLFLADFAPKLLGVYLQQINNHIQGQWCSNRAKQSQFCFLEYCIKPTSTWTILHQHLEAVVLQFIFPQLCFSQTDHELWEEDPVEYVQKKVDPPMEDFKSPVNAAGDLLEAFVRGRTSQTFIPILTMINNVLGNPQLDPRQKHGILTMMCVLSDFAQQNDSISGQMGAFLVSHVFPELASSHNFLRAKACDVISDYSQVEFQNVADLQFAFSNIVRMINDAELPVRVSSSLALGPFLKYPELATALKPHVVGVMQGLLQITNEIDLDTLSPTMELLVYEFADELRPFATQLAGQLVETFTRMMNDNAFSSDDADFDKVEEKTMAAMGILKTLDSLVLSVENSPLIVTELQHIIMPTIVFILDHSILDLFEEAFELIGTCLYCVKQVTPVMWQVFPRIYNTFKMDAVEYLAEMLPSLENYISYGKEVFLTDAEKQHQIVDIIFTAMNDATANARESDKIRAIQLMEALMLSLRGNIDQLIPKFIEAAYQCLSKKIKTAPFRVYCLEIVINSIYYNPVLTLQLLEQINWTSSFFQLWFKNLSSMQRVHDKKLSILALCSLLQLPLSSLPPSLAPMWTHLVSDGLMPLFRTYQSALAERRQMETGDYQDEDYSDFDEHGLLDDDNDSEFADDDDNVETLAHVASAHASNGDSNSDDDSDDELWDVEEFLQEDISFSTVLDTIDAYATLNSTMNHLMSTGQLSVLNEKLSMEWKEQLASFLKSAEKELSQVQSAI